MTRGLVAQTVARTGGPADGRCGVRTATWTAGTDGRTDEEGGRWPVWHRRRQGQPHGRSGQADGGCGCDGTHERAGDNERETGAVEEGDAQ